MMVSGLQGRTTMCPPYVPGTSKGLSMLNRLLTKNPTPKNVVFRQVREGSFDLVGSFVLVVPMRTDIVLARQLLPRGQRMDDEMLQSRALLGSPSDREHLAELPLPSTSLAELHEVVPEVRHGEDGMGILEHFHQRRLIVVIRRSNFCTLRNQRLSSLTVHVASDSSNSPSVFVQHPSGD